MPDVITVDLTAPTPQTLRRISPHAPPLEPRLAGLETLLSLRSDHDAAPWVLVSMVFDVNTAPRVESFFDRWFSRIDRVLLRGREGSQREVSSQATRVFAPPARFACQRLLGQLRIEWDGAIPLCNRDPYHETGVGDLKKQTVAEVWQGEGLRAARRVHQRGGWDGFAHCGPCSSWFRGD